jgi:hypothetical protein
LVEKRLKTGECARCGMDNHAWKFCQTSIMSLSSKGKKPKPKDDHPTDVLSVAGAGRDKPKVQVSASRRIYEVDSNDEMIMN